MSSTANNNSASNPGGGRPSNTTRSAPNMAPDASSSANCDPAANAYTQITLPGGITIAVQAPNLVFTFGDQPSSSSSSSSSEQQGRTVAPFILRQLSASVNANVNGNGNDSNSSNGNGSSGNGSGGLNSSTSSSISSAEIDRIRAYIKRANNRLLSSYRARAASRGAPEEVSRKRRHSPPGTSSEAAEAAPEGE